jgi:hypothetical protein
LKFNSGWTCENLDEFFLRIQFFAERQAQVKDNFVFWTAHAKLLRSLKKKVDSLVELMVKGTKEIKA